MIEAAGLHRRAVDLRARRQSADDVGHRPPAEALHATPHQLPEDGGGRLGVPQGGVDGLDLDLQRLDQAGQARGLTGRPLQDQAGERRGVDDRVLERPRKAAAEDPGVECVMAVLDQDRSTGEMEEGAAGVGELWSVDQHLAPDQVPPLGVGVDRRPAVDQGVEEAQRSAQPEALGADLEHQERPVAGGLDVDGDELRLRQRRVGADRGQLLVPAHRRPIHRLGRPPWLEPQRSLRRFGHVSS